MQSFRSKLDRAVTKAREVLHDAQRPVAAANGDHTYDDKFLLAEYLTRTATTALLTPLQELGLDSKALSSLKALNASETVYLALEREHSCEFIETKVTKEDAKTQHVTKVKVGLLKAKVTNKVVHTITKHYWKFAVKYTLVAYAGNNSKVESKRIVLKDEQADTVLITTVKNTPQPKMKVFPVLRVNLNWLLEHLDEQGAVSTFAINRLVKSCRTPRRNSEIDVVFSFMSTLGSFCNSVRDYFVSVLHRIEPSGHGLDLGSLQQAAIVVPVWPLLNRTSSGGVLSADELKQEQGEGTGVILTVEQTNKLLAAQASDISGAVANILKSFPNTTGVIRSAGCVITALFVHMQHICTEYKLAVDYIEDMLRQQLIAAIGKVVTPADFAEYMSYHQRKLLKPQYHPKPYSYAVRRPEHYPEGVLDIQFRPTSGGLPQPIETLVFENTEKQTPMHFALNASTNVHFTGKQYVHAWLTHQFSGQSQGSYELASRARQFSCFILMIGTLAGAGEFAPQHAIILQNKDAMIIPLLMSHLPTAKEFKDSIESLSPEQQRFAKAYRSMQLASTLFALCVVQIKPQLERLLNLPDQSLTKERRLTQQLMTLFTEYQISSDLVKFDGDMKMSKTEKINIVKQQVNTILNEIEEEQTAALEKKKREAAFAEQERLRIQTQKIQPASESVQYSSFGGFDGSLNKSSSAMPVPRMAMRSSSRAMAPPSAAPMRSKRMGGSPAPAGGPPNRSSFVSREAKAAPAPKSAVTAVPAGKDTNSTTTQQQPGEEDFVTVEGAQGINYTILPAQMDAEFLRFDQDNALRSAILKVGPTWSKKFQTSLLSKPEATTLNSTGQKDAKDKCFDLLDALSRSGELRIENTDLHVVFPVTHCFYDTVLNTVIKDNVNPIEKVEQTVLLLTSIIQHGAEASTLEYANTSQAARLTEFSNPKLFLTDEAKTA